MKLKPTIMLFALALFAEAALLIPTHAQFALPSIVEPAQYASPSGKYVLHVDPDDKYAQGGAAYRLTKAGKTIWSGRRPYTLLDADVSDAGVAGGYGYFNGGSLLKPSVAIVLFDPSGKLRREERIERKSTLVPDAAPMPLGEGVFIEPGQDRFVVRLDVWNYQKHDSSAVWRQYRLSSGARLPDFDPKRLLADRDSYAWIAAAKHVAGTPLTLIHWCAVDDAEFALIDGDRKTVWKTSFPNDYAGDEKHDKRTALIAQARRLGAILHTQRHGRFALWSVARNARIDYSVAPTGNGRWKVSETGRARYPMPDKPAAPVAAITLRSLGGLTLSIPSQARSTQFEMINPIAINNAGQIAILDERASRVHVFSPNGRWLHSCSIPARTADSPPMPPSISLAPKGDLFVDYPGWDGKGRRIHFAEDGRRLRDVARLRDDVSEWDRDAIRLIGRDGRTLRVVSRRVDGSWFGAAYNPVVGADGSFCIVDLDDLFSGRDAEHVSLYSPLGVPLRTFSLPKLPGDGQGFDYNGRIVVTAASGSLYGIDKFGHALWRFTPKPLRSGIEPHFTNDGRTLTVRTGGMRFERYALP